MYSNRFVPVLTAIGIGVVTGVYVFQPLLKEYQKQVYQHKRDLVFSH